MNITENAFEGGFSVIFFCLDMENQPKEREIKSLLQITKNLRSWSKITLA
ncbi:hypothetical protein [Ectobacillus panaciterrae]|nr:hypothetical protein [Ectobacillus panaciterrae]